MTLHYNYTTKTLLISALMGISSWLTAGAAAPTDDPDTGAKSEETTGENSDMLNGPVEIPGEADDIDIPIPSFIHMNANHITYNGADWSRLRKAFLESAVSPVSIVHIGDSHIQADISTDRKSVV